jgi:outer membrane protein OmpA-like peptidoglycan-associated protein
MAARERVAVGYHPDRPTPPLLVAASTGNEINTIRVRHLPIACWRLEDLRFEFDKSFVRPEAAHEMGQLKRLWDRVGKPPMSIFGHADPVGDDAYNKTLSGRRAQSVYGLITRDIDKWEELYTRPFSTDDWSRDTLPTMLATVGAGSVRAFQQSQGDLAVDGIAGPLTRAKLFRAYMDTIVRDDSGQPYQMARTDFLGRGVDAGGKADFQGCSEFNPILSFSRLEETIYKEPALREVRNADNQPNRRVLVFLFRPGAQVSPEAWPCPRASEPDAGCRREFWPDGDVRRSPHETRRLYENDEDTFACAFYDAMARLSPCETQRKLLRIRLSAPDKNAIPHAPYKLTVAATGDVRDGVADAQGVLTEDEVLAPSRITIDVGDPRLGQKPTPLGYRMEVNLDLDDEDVDDETVRRRLQNVGYTDTEFLSDALRAFQRDYGLTVTGKHDTATRNALIAAADRGTTKSELGHG